MMTFYLMRTSTTMSHLGDYIKKKRKELELTQLEIGNYLGVTNVFVGRVELGCCLLPFKHLGKIAQRFDVDKEEVVRLWKKDAIKKINDKLGE